MAEPINAGNGVAAHTQPNRLVGAVLLGSLGAGVAHWFFPTSPGVVGLIASGLTLLFVLAGPKAKPQLCGRCGLPLTGTATQALGRVWHHECFVCTKCSIPLIGQIYQIENQPYCKNCVGAVAPR